MVTPGVKGEVERLLRQACGCLGLNGQCTVANLKQLLIYLDLSSAGPKAELMQRVYNHAESLHSYMGLPTDIAFVLGGLELGGVFSGVPQQRGQNQKWLYNPLPWGPHGGERYGYTTPCRLGNPIVGKDQHGYITPAFSWSP